MLLQVHVNFPQPPQYEQSEQHLVNTLFLTEAYPTTLTLTINLIQISIKPNPNPNPQLLN